jgi:O-acetyl-ADP-ribose deacetylase (regulator of RNase III)
MDLKIIHGDLFANSSDAILLNIDGDGKTEGMEGRLARHFRKTSPELWEEIMKFRPESIGLGNIFTYRPSDDATSQYKAVIIASTHNHLDDLSEDERQAVAYTAFKRALQSAVKFKIKSLATPLLVGGWRLGVDRAFLAMTQAIEEIKGAPDTEVCLYVFEEDKYRQTMGYASSLGWL